MGKLSANGRPLAILSRHRRRHPGRHWILDHRCPHSPRLHAGDLALLCFVALPGLQNISQEEPAELVASTGNNMPQMWARSNETLARRIGGAQRYLSRVIMLKQRHDRYRRNFAAGGSFFFAVNLAERHLRLLTDHIDELRTAFRETRRHHPFTIDAMVVLPDHLHTIWTLPEGDADFATRWRLIKSASSRSLATGERISESRAAKGERGIWQRRYWEHTIRDGNDFARHTDYVHINPVKHRLVTRVRDWPYSSFHRMVKLGVYPADWAGDISNDGDAFGERP